MITHEELLSVLAYNPYTGDFFWRDRGHGKRQNRPVGSIMTTGYRHIVINNKAYLAHRLAWFHTYGVMPEGCIDHINGERHDNRIANLRVATHVGNCQNQRKAHSRNKSGLLGVCSDSPGRYRARIKSNGKDYIIGTFSDPLEAHEAYKQAKRAMHETCTI